MKTSMIKKLTATIVGAGLATLMATTPASALLVGGPDIIGAPASVFDDAIGGGAENDHQQAFNEVQGYTLLADLAIDGGIITAGTTVNSHMVFLNSAGNTRITDNGVEWTFNGAILGVMSDIHGVSEGLSNAFLGNPGTLYPGSFNNRGMENNNDGYVMLGNMLTVNMLVTEPGDWIRVVTAVPLPAAFPLYAAGIALLGFMGWRRRKIAA